MEVSLQMNGSLSKMTYITDCMFCYESDFFCWCEGGGGGVGGGAEKRGGRGSISLSPAHYCNK